MEAEHCFKGQGGCVLGVAKMAVRDNKIMMMMTMMMMMIIIIII